MSLLHLQEFRYVQAPMVILFLTCLSEHWFTSLNHVKVVIDAWRKEQIEEKHNRPLGGLSPAAYLQTLQRNAFKFPSEPKAGCY